MGVPLKVNLGGRLRAEGTPLLSTANCCHRTALRQKSSREAAIPPTKEQWSRRAVLKELLTELLNFCLADMPVLAFVGLKVSGTNRNRHGCMSAFPALRLKISDCFRKEKLSAIYLQATPSLRRLDHLALQARHRRPSGGRSDSCVSHALQVQSHAAIGG